MGGARKLNKTDNQLIYSPSDLINFLDFIFSKNRLNVALSRAKTLAIVVGNPELANTQCNTVKQIELVNLYCKILNEKQTHDK